MPKLSAGILLYRRGPDGVEVFLVHPGGPFFARKDEGAWSIPKGEVEKGEEPLEVALREFREETGKPLKVCASAIELVSLGAIQQRGGKKVHAWAVEGNWPEGAEIRSNTFELEWPPRSRQRQTFPEVDRAEFFDAATARRKINPAQVELIDRLMEEVGGKQKDGPEGPPLRTGPGD